MNTASPLICEYKLYCAVLLVRADLTTTGPSLASNMLHSIYGSQVSQLPISEYNLDEDESDTDDEWTRICFSTPHLTRPRSAAVLPSYLQRNNPASTTFSSSNNQKNIDPARRLSLQSKLSASSLSSTSLLKPHCKNPTTRIRPQTAIAGSVHTQVIRRRSSVSVQPSNRPKTAMCYNNNTYSRSTSLKRPRTAHIIRSASSSADETRVQPVIASLQNSSTPVALSSTPQYFDFWNEKPLKPRDWSRKTYPRKPWKRPKSSYGLLNGHGDSKKNGNQSRNGFTETDDVNNSGHNAAATSDNDNKTGSNNSDYHAGIDHDDKNRLDNNGLDTDHNNTETDHNNTDTDHNNTDTDHNNNLQSNGTKNSTGDDSSHGNNNYKGGDGNCNEDDENSKHGEGREVLGRQDWNGVDENDYFSSKTNQSSSTTWLDSGGSSSSVTRFNLPVDMKSLEEITPMDYLKTHCILSNQRKSHYSKIFAALCKHRYMSTRKEIIKGISNALYKLLPKEHIEFVCEIVRLSSVNLLIDKIQFGNICAVAERLYGNYLPAGINREIIEVVDFEALQWKLQGCLITKELHTLLFKLSCGIS